MRQEFEDLHEMLKEASSGAYPAIPDFTLKAPTVPLFTFSPLDVLDNPASKFARILGSFLDKDGDLILNGSEDPSAKISAYKEYAARGKMLKNLSDTVAEIDADILELTLEDVHEFQKLEYLKEVFTEYKLSLEADFEMSKSRFEETLHRDLGRRIRQIRHQQGLTIEEFANRVYLSRVTLNRYELGIRVPSVATLFQISYAFGVSVDWLLEVEMDEENR